jgi:hypothetical protein
MCASAIGLGKSRRCRPSRTSEVYWSEQSSDEMFNGWMKVSADEDVITKPGSQTDQQQQ